MRYLLGLLCVCALGAMPLVGCSESTGNGGSGGDAGSGGTAGDGGSAGSGGAIFSIGGTVTGLIGGTLVLQNNGADDVSLGDNGPFTFASLLSDGSAYVVTVSSQPSSPKQFCRVDDGSGTVTGADVTGVAVRCSNGPMVLRFARFRDEDRDGSASADDVLIVPFDLDVRVNNADPADFTLPVSGDSLGSGAVVSDGPTSFDVSIKLGTNARLRSSGTYDPANVAAGDPSGIDVSAALSPDAIEGVDGRDAISSIPINVIPEFVDTGQSLNPDDATTGVALGDVDGDGDLDLVKANNGLPSPNRVYTNDGDGNFVDSGQTLGNDATRDVVLGDVDGDDDLDIVAGNDLSASRVYFNDGQGNFVDGGQALGTISDRSESVALGDIDNDGDLDLVIGNGTTANQVYLNDGEGAFTDTGQALGASNTTWAVALGDMDGDGDLDLIEGNGATAGESPNRVYFNDGAGTFTDSGQSLGVSITLALALGDIDDDGDLDLATGDSSALRNRVYTNDGMGVLTDSGQSLGGTNTSSIDLRDVDSDGDLDFVSGDLSEVRVFINDSTGRFVDSGQTLQNRELKSIALGDLDGDGDLDLAVGNGFFSGSGAGSRIYTGSLTDQ